jgi:hypothetical protein
MLPGAFASRTKATNALRDLKQLAQQTMTGLGFVEDEAQYRVYNEYRYVHTQWLYQRNYPSPAGLRPNLQLEFTVRTPALEFNQLPIGTLADRLAKKNGKTLQVPTICIAETLAEKILSFLRRFAQHRAGQMKQPWDTALVRHIYDVHCIGQQSFAHIEAALPIFKSLVEGDKAEYGAQFPPFRDDARSLLEQTLIQTRVDPQTRREYEEQLLPLIYGGQKPAFEQAHESFSAAAMRLIETL